LEHRGQRSQGIRCEGYVTSEPVFMHLLELTADEVGSLRILAGFKNRFAPSIHSAWWFAGKGAKAHWPGRTTVRSSLLAGRAEPVADHLVPRLRAEFG
jgi:hypothetical protein